MFAFLYFLFITFCCFLWRFSLKECIFLLSWEIFYVSFPEESGSRKGRFALIWQCKHIQSIIAGEDLAAGPWSGWPHFISSHEEESSEADTLLTFFFSFLCSQGLHLMRPSMFWVGILFLHVSGNSFKTTPGVVAPGWFHIWLSCQWILTATSIENSLSKSFSISKCTVSESFVLCCW